LPITVEKNRNGYGVCGSTNTHLEKIGLYFIDSIEFMLIVVPLISKVLSFQSIVASKVPERSVTIVERRLRKKREVVFVIKHGRRESFKMVELRMSWSRNV